jgi:RND family efflux transporter MFP subunit
MFDMTLSTSRLSRLIAPALSLAVVFSMLGAMSGCSGEAGGTTRPAASREALVSKVHVVEAAPMEHRETWRVRGVLEPAESAHVAFIVGGRLTDVLVHRGDHVERGQVLARLDTAEVNAGVAQTNAAVAAADAQVRLARDALSRLESLDREQAIAGAEVTKIRLQLEAAEALRAQARAAQQMASVKASQHVLRSPLAGTVLDVPETLGEIVGPGIPQVEVASLDRLEVGVTVPAEAAGRVREGQGVKVHPRSGSPLEGTVRRIMPALTADTHRLPVEIEVVPPVGQVGLANSYVEVEIQATDLVIAASIPATALRREDQTWVFVVGEDDVVQRRPVSILRSDGDRVVIGGIEPGSRVVDLPRIDLVDGARIQR